MTIDTLTTTEIAGSPWKMLGLGLLGLGMVAGSAALAAPELHGARFDSTVRIIGAVGVLVFGLFTTLILWRAATTRGAVVTLTPTGIRDVRVSAREIPWSAVRSISTWSNQGQRIMVLDVDPAVEATLGLTAIARWTRGANRSLGADGLCVTAQGLATTYDDLMALAKAYARASPASHDT